MTRYDFVFLMHNAQHSWKEAHVEAEGFLAAFSEVLAKDRTLESGHCTVYCRQPKSGNLQLMGEWRGPSYGHCHVFIKAGEGKRYNLTPDGFILEGL